MSAREKKDFIEMLVRLRERMRSQISTLTAESLRRQDKVNLAEEGTDAFDRQFALNLASSEQQVLAQVETALRRFEDGTYGICNECDQSIEKIRLKALPFVEMCIKCQSEYEKGKPKFHPM